MKYKDEMFDLPMLIKKLELAAEELDLIYPKEIFDIVLVGGSALMLMDIKGKVTNDIDVFTVSDKKIVSILENYSMNTRVSAHSDNFSVDMETRYERIKSVNCKNVRYFTCCLEDLVASKLGTSRDKDILDISKNDVINRIDVELLDKIVYEELKIDYFSESRYKILLDNYKEYRKLIENAKKKKS